VEMYTLARKSLDVDELFKETQQEINSSYEYLAIKLDQKQTKSTTRLTVVATIGLIAVLVISFMGMSIFDKDNSGNICQLIRESIVKRWNVFAGLVFVFTLFLAAIIFISASASKFIDWLADFLLKKK